MGKTNTALLAFNRGQISPLALARTDLERTSLSAEIQKNYIPRVLGSMSLRPGLQYLLATESNNTAIHIPFIYATDDTAILQISDQNMRVIIDDAVVTRASVSSAISNGSFDSDLSNWTNADESGATSIWSVGGYMALQGTGRKEARRRQSVSVSGADENVAHAIRLTIQRGPVTIRVGTSAGLSDYFEETLAAGTHSLVFTPTGPFEIELSGSKEYTVLVSSIEIEGPIILDIPVPWTGDDLGKIRWIQSADVIFVACEGYKPYRIERRGLTSWSVVEYEANDGPFRAINTSSITMTPSALSGDISITASAPFFKETNVGGLIKIESIGQTVEVAASAEDTWTDPIRVTGVDNSRIFDISITGTWSGTVTVQRSVAEPGDWSDVSSLSYTSNTTTTHDDGLDNQIIYYRIGIKSGDYTSGTATVNLSYGSGSNTGIARIVSYIDTQTVSAIVLNSMGGTDASLNWYEGEWSDRRGYPSAVEIYESRLCFSGKSKVWLSVTDAYTSFDDEVEGDSGPINRTLGSGPVDSTNWMFAGNRLVMGTDGAEASIRSSSFDEPLSPTAFNIKFPSNIGSAPVPPAKVDNTCIFVSRGQTEIYKLVYNDATYDYQPGGLTTLVPDIGDPAIVRLAAQRQPDTRIHCVRSDGVVVMLITDPAEDVSCWVTIETDGEVEDAFVLPDSSTEDRVYYLVKRTINGSTVRYLEKMALESECAGGTLNKQADSFITYSGASTTTITGLDHLEGEDVVVWGDGQYNGSYTVSSGTITLATSVTSAVIGLTYTAQYKSVKLAYASQFGAALLQKKRVNQLGLIMQNVYKDGVKYGPDFNTLDDLPLMEDGAVVADGTVHATYDEMTFPFNGTFDTDSRVCLQSQAPKPATILAIVLGIQTNEKI